MRRVPPLLWTRLLADLIDYIVIKGVFEANVYSWYHRQVRPVC